MATSILSIFAFIAILFTSILLQMSVLADGRVVGFVVSTTARGIDKSSNINNIPLLEEKSWLRTWKE